MLVRIVVLNSRINTTLVPFIIVYLFSSDLTPAAGRNIGHNFPVPWYYLGCSLFVSPAAASILLKMWPDWGRPHLCVAD